MLERKEDGWYIEKDKNYEPISLNFEFYSSSSTQDGQEFASLTLSEICRCCKKDNISYLCACSLQIKLLTVTCPNSRVLAQKQKLFDFGKIRQTEIFRETYLPAL